MKIAVLNSCCLPPSVTSSPTFDTVFGNTGNAVIYAGLGSLLPCKPSLVLPSLFGFSSIAYRSDGSLLKGLSIITQEIRTCDATILILQDLARHDAYVTRAQVGAAKSLLSCSRNLFVFSLGSNCLVFNRNDHAATVDLIFSTLPDFILDFLRFILDKALLVSVRGQITADVLSLVRQNPIARISIDGCPSLSGRCLDHKALLGYSSRIINGSLPLFVTGGLFGLRQRRTLLRAFHVAQEKCELNPFFNHVISQEFTHESVLLSIFRRKKLFLEPARWSDWLAVLAQSSKPVSYCGTRVHGLIQALVSGIPGVLLSGDSRALEMASLYGIPLMHGACLEDVSDIVASHDFSRLLDRHALVSARLRESISLLSAC